MTQQIFHYYSPEDYAALEGPDNPDGTDDSVGRITAEYDNECNLWCVRCADLNGPNERPIRDEDPAGGGFKAFFEVVDLHEWMKQNGFICA